MKFIIENRKLIKTKNLGRDTEVVVPDDTIIIGKSAFSNQKIRSVYLPDSVSTIEAGAFENCDRLETIRLSSRIKVIEILRICWNHFQDSTYIHKPYI